MTDICTVVAIFTPKPEYREAIRELLCRVTPLVHDEPGCEFYTMNETPDGQFIHIEAWTTKQHWIDHMEQQNVEEILSGVEGKLIRDVEVFEAYNVLTGTSGKGSLAQSQPSA